MFTIDNVQSGMEVCQNRAVLYLILPFATPAPGLKERIAARAS